jgi:hypothetical protein
MHRLVDQPQLEHRTERQKWGKHKTHWEANHRNKRTNPLSTVDNNLKYRIHERMVVTNAGQRGNETKPALPPTNLISIVREVRAIVAMRVMLVLQLQVLEPRLLL